MYMNMYVATELALHGNHCILPMASNINHDKMSHPGNQEVNDETAASDFVAIISHEDAARLQHNTCCNRHTA